MDILLQYFQGISDIQKNQFYQLEGLYNYWNERINVISRKDIGQLYERHILHSLAIAKFFRFKSGDRILDVGTGGGFPGIPLAIFFPEANFTLADSIGKKITVVKDISAKLNLNNVRALNTRAETINEKFDFVVSRAVTNFPAFVKLIENKIDRSLDLSRLNGIIYLKGGEITSEIEPFKNKVKVFNISDVFNTEFFDSKKVIFYSF